MSLREKLTHARIAEAFEKTSKQVEVPYGKLALITEEYYDAAQQVFTDSLLKDEPTCEALNVGMGPTTRMFFEETIKQNMSLMLVDTVTDEIMGIRVMCVASDDESPGANDDDDDGTKSLFQFWQFCDEKAEFFKHFNTRECIMFYGLGVCRKYRKMGVATKLMEAALSLIRNFEVSPIYVKGSTSSLYSDKVYQKMCFEPLFEICYADYIIDGKQVIQTTEEHPTFKVYGKAL